MSCDGVDRDRKRIKCLSFNRANEEKDKWFIGLCCDWKEKKIVKCKLAYIIDIKIVE